MKTVFARALVVAAVFALPASAFASTESAHHHAVAKKETSKKKSGKHRGHKTASKAHATPATKAP